MPTQQVGVSSKKSWKLQESQKCGFPRVVIIL